MHNDKHTKSFGANGHIYMYMYNLKHSKRLWEHDKAC